MKANYEVFFSENETKIPETKQRIILVIKEGIKYGAVTSPADKGCFIRFQKPESLFRWFAMESIKSRTDFRVKTINLLEEFIKLYEEKHNEHDFNEIAKGIWFILNQ